MSIGEGIITIDEREFILRSLEARTFPSAGKRHGRTQGMCLLTGIARCGYCGSRMSKEGTSYQCSKHRMGRGCAGVSARVESILRGEFDGPAAVERYGELTGRLGRRIDGLRADLLRMPLPSVDVSTFLEDRLLCGAREADGVTGRRDLLGLAIDRDEVRRGRVGVRFTGEERCRIGWAAESDAAGQPVPQP
ncbi:zinc ribbon domain-containing protein [Streptomyces sp. E-08]|uniref:zinc ribbon domain-containing protein n=1 Tax=Streptomyces sp. E-08 TaxID=3404047 RepID=UPI003CE9C94F